jgi:hypothetical protein
MESAYTGTRDSQVFIPIVIFQENDYNWSLFLYYALTSKPLWSIVWLLY